MYTYPYNWNSGVSLVHNLLVIDDDYTLFELLSEYLGNAGFRCTHAPDGDSGLVALDGGAWDVVILDVMLPGKNGHEVLQSIRARPPLRRLPVLMLTARGDEDDKVQGLELGADDYLAKPFGPKELVARLRALLRRTATGHPAVPSRLTLDDLEIDKASLLVLRNGERIEITAPEMRLLELLTESPGQVVDRTVLYQEVLRHKPFPQDRSLDMMISRLRKKLGPRSDGGERVRASRGQGYIFLVSGDN